MQRELENLNEDRDHFIDLYIKGKIDDSFYAFKQQKFAEREKEIINNIQISELPKSDFDKCLNSCLSVIKNLDKAWKDSVLRIKKNLQKLIFPNGLNADFKNFKNAEKASIFKQIDSLTESSNGLVLPRGFEPLSHP